MKKIMTVLLATIALTIGLSAQVYASNTQITGGTNGADCNSGGYFTPKAATIKAGDTVTIAVPANDPYAGGIEVHGFPEGSFVVLPGASHTTHTIANDVSYYGTWPSTGCMKGTGTVTVSQTTPSTSPTVVPNSSPTTPPTASPTTAQAQQTPAKTMNVGVIIAGIVVVLLVVFGVWRGMASRHRQ